VSVLNLGVKGVLGVAYTFSSGKGKEGEI